MMFGENKKGKVQKMENEKLLPCPLCGGSAEYRNDGMSGYVQCQNCLARTDSIYSWRDENWKKEAAQDWNVRTHCPECEKKEKSIKNLSQLSEKLLLTMQAAYIESYNSCADKAMLWIENILYETGLIPDVPKGTTAQYFFDKEISKLESSRRNE